MRECSCVCLYVCMCVCVCVVRASCVCSSMCGKGGVQRKRIADHLLCVQILITVSWVCNGACARRYLPSRRCTIHVAFRTLPMSPSIHAFGACITVCSYSITMRKSRYLFCTSRLRQAVIAVCLLLFSPIGPCTRPPQYIHGCMWLSYAYLSRLGVCVYVCVSECVWGVCVSRYANLCRRMTSITPEPTNTKQEWPVNWHTIY